MEAAFERRLDRFQRSLRELQVAYQRFLNGEDPKPPEELRDRLAAELRDLQSQQLRRAVDQFRLANLEARFNSYREMFQRRVRAVEEGRLPEAARSTRGGAHDVERGIVLTSGRGAGAEELFESLVARSASAAMDLDAFRRFLDRQIAAIRQKTGCEEVHFRLAEEEGKVKLKARPLAR